MAKPEAYIFDVFGTLVDWRKSVAAYVTPFFEGKGIETDNRAFADYWRGRYEPAMDRIRSGNRGYVPLDDLHFENLSETLQHFDLAEQFDEHERLQLNRAWEHLNPWSDVVPGLTALKQTAIIAPCSNGSIALMSRLAKHAGLPWDCILGADIAQNYKPHPAVYDACCKALRLDPSKIMMVAAHNSDLEAAKSAGLRTAFIPRVTEYGEHQDKDFEATSEWDLVVEKIEDLAN